MTTNQTITKSLLGILCCSMLASCAFFRPDRDPDGIPDRDHESPFTQADLIGMADEMATSILSHPFPPAGPVPTIATPGIINNTGVTLDIPAFECKLIAGLTGQSQIQVVEVTPSDTKVTMADRSATAEVQLGRRLGVRYVLSGSITELSPTRHPKGRAGNGIDAFYQLTILITDSETGLIVLRKQSERRRRPSKTDLSH